MKCVVEPAPPVKNAATNDETIKKDHRWRHDKTQAKPIPEIQRLTLDDPIPFEFGVTSLRIQPAPQRFSIIVQQRCVQLFYRTIDNHALRVSVLNVRRRFTSIQHGHGRIDAAVQFFAVDAVDKVCTIAGGVCVGVEIFEFGDRVAGEDVIGVEREDPGSLNTRFAQAKLPLIAMAVKSALNDSDVRE